MTYELSAATVEYQISTVQVFTSSGTVLFYSNYFLFASSAIPIDLDTDHRSF